MQGSGTSWTSSRKLATGARCISKSATAICVAVDDRPGGEFVRVEWDDDQK